MINLTIIIVGLVSFALIPVFSRNLEGIKRYERQALILRLYIAIACVAVFACGAFLLYSGIKVKFFFIDYNQSYKLCYYALMGWIPVYALIFAIYYFINLKSEYNGAFVIFSIAGSAIIAVAAFIVLLFYAHYADVAWHESYFYGENADSYVYITGQLLIVMNVLFVLNLVYSVLLNFNNKKQRAFLMTNPSAR